MVCAASGCGRGQRLTSRLYLRAEGQLPQSTANLLKGEPPHDVFSAMTYSIPRATKPFKIAAFVSNTMLWIA